MGTIENCPICGEKMEKGFLASRVGITWSSRKRKWYEEGFERLTKHSIWSSPAYDQAYRCRECKIVIFSYVVEKEEDEGG